jgi:two-component system, OmpR family, sensor histidine kinase VicK
MVFKRKKLLNRLLIITLCTTLIPLIVAGLYLIPKINVDIENVTNDQVAGQERNLWLNFGIILLFGFILSLLGTTYYLKKITGPLDRFARSATEIARGNFNQRIELESDDEIGRLARIFNYMTIELRRLYNMNLNRIITERTKTKTIIKNIGDGIIVTDEQDRIVTVNVAVENWFGIQENEVVEKPIREIIKEKELLNLIEDIKETDLEGTFTRDLLTTIDQDKEMVFQARATKLLNQENEYMGVVAILRDVTQEKEIDRMKTELVSMVAHELRSPLTSISGFAELLLSPHESQKSVHEYANVIQVEAGRLAELVNKFLDISKIEAGRMDYKPATLKIKQIIDSIFHIAVVQAQKKDIKLSLIFVDEDLEVFADGKMISEVILNLLSNAIKYSPEKTQAKLSIEDNHNFTHIQVSDQGFGISEEHLPNIFKKFYRIKDDPRILEERGTGLGLTLVKEIVELHKGRIDVKSQIGKGTTFKIKLPNPKPSTGWQQ